MIVAIFVHHLQSTGMDYMDMDFVRLKLLSKFLKIVLILSEELILYERYLDQ